MPLRVLVCNQKLVKICENKEKLFENNYGAKNDQKKMY